MISEKGGVYGPIIIPANKYPTTIDCFNLCVMKSITAAITIITAKSCTMNSDDPKLVNDNALKTTLGKKISMIQIKYKHLK